MPGLEFHDKGLNCKLFYAKGGKSTFVSAGPAATQVEGAAILAAAMRFARNRNDKAAKAMLSGGAADRIKLTFHQQPEGEGPIITWQKRQRAVVELFGFEM